MVLSRDLIPSIDGQKQLDCQEKTIPDPLYTIHRVKVTDEIHVDMTRGGMVRETHINDASPPLASFTTGGQMLVETQSGETHTAIRSMRANLQKSDSGECDKYRVLLPKTGMVVCPKNAMQRWRTACREVWPTARVFEIKNKASFKRNGGLSDALCPSSGDSTVDIVLLSRNVLFKEYKLNLWTPKLMKPKAEMINNESRDIHILEKVIFNTVVITAAHAYTKMPDVTLSIGAINGGMVLNSAAVAIRKLAYGRSTILSTPTPFESSVLSDDINNYMAMVGMVHTEYGPIMPRPTNYEETHRVMSMHAVQRWRGSVIPGSGTNTRRSQHPSRIAGKGVTNVGFFLLVHDADVVHRAHIAFMSNCVAHTADSVSHTQTDAVIQRPSKRQKK
jgi:hypothetical protein